MLIREEAPLPVHLPEPFRLSWGDDLCCMPGCCSKLVFKEIDQCCLQGRRSSTWSVVLDYDLHASSSGGLEGLQQRRMAFRSGPLVDLSLVEEVGEFKDASKEVVAWMNREG